MRLALSTFIAVLAIIGIPSVSIAQTSISDGYQTFHEDYSARRKIKRHGACDGFQRCRCGVTAARKAGLPLTYNGFNLKRAVEWIRAFPRTSIHAGAVGYVRKGGPSGHVFTVVSYNGGATATVYDDRGTYERAIGNAIFVNPSGRMAAGYSSPDRMTIN